MFAFAYGTSSLVRPRTAAPPIPRGLGAQRAAAHCDGGATRRVARSPRSAAAFKLARAGGVAACPARADAGSRHGVTVTVLLAGLQLLVSSVSSTAFVPSAHASRK